MSPHPVPTPPGPGQESVWDYPRPPALERSSRVVEVHTTDGRLVGRSDRAWRVLETSHPPTWYLPREDIAPGMLTRSAARGSLCEWKGTATYWDVEGDDAARAAAWSYETPTARFAAMTGAVTFYPDRLVCAVDGERVRPQEGGFYGGWITDDVVGPFKGGPGSWGW